MLTIRLQRIGKKHQPGYRIVVAKKRSKLGGPPVEQIGSYDPFTKKAAVKKERADHWLKVGAKASPTVHNLFVKGGVVSGAKIAIKINNPKSAESAGEVPAATAAPAAAPAAEKSAAGAEESAGAEKLKEEPVNEGQKDSQTEA